MALKKRCLKIQLRSRFSTVGELQVFLMIPVQALKSLSLLSGDAQKTTFNRNLTSHGCKADGNYAIVVHGWHESIRTPWVEDLISNLILNRGGCVIFMDYSRHGNAVNYNLLVRKFDSLAAVLLKKVKQIGNYDRLFMFGFSYGARLSFEAGARLGHQKIERIDACDPAGPGFEHRRTADPKVAAKNVACINTSIDKGTNIYNCHQNFRMGKCGLFQPAAGPPPLSSHGMCPYFYNSAFKNDFKADNVENCVSNRMVKEMPEGFKMGYMEKRGS